MARLHNKFGKPDLLKRLAQENFDRVTLSFYQYAKIEDPQAFRDQLYAEWDALGVLGRTYVAHEGINAQISVPEPNFEALKAQLYAFPFLNGIRLNVAVEQAHESFLKLIVKVRDKIVADGIDDPNFDATQCGTHLGAKEFNEKLESPDTVVVDFRNYYESEIGHFKNAITPDVETFRESLPIIAEEMENAKDKTFLMYCTGGIRCEKASAYMRYKGFKNVYQLEGGIIEYTRQCNELGVENKFIGKNFVFDERLGERISNEVIAKCHQCGTTCDTHNNCANVSCNLLFIQCPTCAEKYNKCCSQDCKTIYDKRMSGETEGLPTKAAKQRYYNPSKHKPLV